MTHQLPMDYLVDLLRVDLAKLGYARVIVLSDNDTLTEGLRAGLARWGFQVLTAPAEERAWIAALAAGYATPVAKVIPTTNATQAQHGHSPSPADLERLRALLADGLEHGVQAIICTSDALAALATSCASSVPILTPAPQESLVPVRAVVFDMGGVLFHWDPLAMAQRVSETDADAQLLAEAVFGSLEWAWQDAGAVDEQTVLWTSKARVPRRLHNAVDELVLRWHEHRVPIEGAEELICDLKAAGYGIYLLSNAGESFARYEAHLPGRACFDGLVVSCYEHVVKPDARIYRTLLDRYGLAANECLFIDDTPRNVHAARRLGMRGWHFTGDIASLRSALV